MSKLSKGIAENFQTHKSHAIDSEHCHLCQAIDLYIVPSTFSLKKIPKVCWVNHLLLQTL